MSRYDDCSREELIRRIEELERQLGPADRECRALPGTLCLQNTRFHTRHADRPRPAGAARGACFRRGDQPCRRSERRDRRAEYPGDALLRGLPQRAQQPRKRLRHGVRFLFAPRHHARRPDAQLREPYFSARRRARPLHLPRHHRCRGGQARAGDGQIRAEQRRRGDLRLRPRRHDGVRQRTVPPAPQHHRRTVLPQGL